MTERADRPTTREPLRAITEAPQDSHVPLLVPNAAPEEGVRLLSLVNLVLRNITFVLGLGVLFLAGAVAMTIGQPTTYTAIASFVSSGSSQSPGISGIAAQFGFSMPGSQGSQSPAFLADLVKSRVILGAVADATYNYPSERGPVTGTLIDIYQKDKSIPLAQRRDRTIASLRGSITSIFSAKTGVVEVSVTVTSPVLAYQLVTRLADEVNRFNYEMRQSRATFERKFTEPRLNEVTAELRAAESRLQDFLQHNREYRASPELTFQQERLNRDVQFRQQVQVSLAQALEQAKLEQLRDTPVTTFVERPEVPAQPNPRGRVTKWVFAFLLGSGMGALLALLVQLASGVTDDGSELSEFLRLMTRLLGPLRRPVQWLARMIRPNDSRTT